MRSARSCRTREVMRLPGGHVGIVAGRSAAALWQQTVDFLAATGRVCGRRASTSRGDARGRVDGFPFRRVAWSSDSRGRLGPRRAAAARPGPGQQRGHVEAVHGPVPRTADHPPRCPWHRSVEHTGLPGRGSRTRPTCSSRSSTNAASDGPTWSVSRTAAPSRNSSRTIIRRGSAAGAGRDLLRHGVGAGLAGGHDEPGDAAALLLAELLQPDRAHRRRAASPGATRACGTG